jgi:RHS repeat-associated protein
MKSTTYTYDARGQRATVTKGNGNVVTRTYFESGQTKKTEEMDGARLVARHELTYNLEGDRKTDTSRVSHGEGGADLEQVATYTYTPARQLESVTKSGASAGKNEAYQYDAAGNTTCQTIGSSVTQLKYTRNRLTQTWPGVTDCATSTPPTKVKHEYDAWGRASVVKVATTGAPIKEYTYDGFDRVVSDKSFLSTGANDVTTTTTYDAFDRTMTKSSKVRSNAAKMTRFVYLGLSDQVANEEQKNSSDAWTVSKAFSYGPGGEKLSMVDSPVGGGGSPQTYFYGTNPHGDVETLTDNDGVTKASYRYEAFGGLDSSGTTGLDKLMNDPVQDADIVNPYRFNSMRVDGATGQYDMGFRNYDPGLNRYLTRDSYNGALDDLALGMDPWNTNRYAFAGGNPISFVELDGHLAAPASDGGGGTCDSECQDSLPDYDAETGEVSYPEPEAECSLKCKANNYLGGAGLAAAELFPINISQAGKGLCGRTCSSVPVVSNSDLIKNNDDFESTYDSSSFEFQAGYWVGLPLGSGGGAGAAARVGRRVVTNTAQHALPAFPRALAGGPTSSHVYLGIKNGTAAYAGITNNMTRRAAQHGARFDQLQQLTSTGLQRGQARAIEEALILRNAGTFSNLRHEISMSHAYYGDAVQWGEAWLVKNGF